MLRLAKCEFTTALQSGVSTPLLTSLPRTLCPLRPLCPADPFMIVDLPASNLKPDTTYTSWFEVRNKNNNKAQQLRNGRLGQPRNGGLGASGSAGGRWRRTAAPRHRRPPSRSFPMACPLFLCSLVTTWTH